MLSDFNKKSQVSNDKILSTNLSNIWNNETKEILKTIRGDIRYLNIVESKNDTLSESQIKTTEESIIMKSADCIYKYREDKKMLLNKLKTITEENQKVSRNC